MRFFRRLRRLYMLAVMLDSLDVSARLNKRTLLIELYPRAIRKPRDPSGAREARSRGHAPVPVEGLSESAPESVRVRTGEARESKGSGAPARAYPREPVDESEDSLAWAVGAYLACALFVVVFAVLVLAVARGL